MSCSVTVRRVKQKAEPERQDGKQPGEISPGRAAEVDPLTGGIRDDDAEPLLAKRPLRGRTFHECEVKPGCEGGHEISQTPDVRITEFPRRRRTRQQEERRIKNDGVHD
jgi:ssDNA-binding Zn-finger/Zn-ribbon topoisomerase 1